MTIQQIEFFISVAKHLSFTKAAEENITTQPTISRQINLLEEELGFALFIRTKKNVCLTPQAAILLDELKRIPDIINKATQKALISGKTSMTIGILEEIDEYAQLAEQFDFFSKKCPNSNLSIERQNFAGLRAGLENGSYDAIVTLQFEDHFIKDAVSKKICDLKTFIIMSKEHPLAKKEDLAVHDLKDETFILPSPEVTSGRVDELQAIIQNFGFTCKTLAVSQNTESSLVSVRACKGVSLVNSMTRGISFEKYRVIELPYEIAPLSLVLIWKRNNSNSALHTFILQMKENSDT